MTAAATLALLGLGVPGCFSLELRTDSAAGADAAADGGEGVDGPSASEGGTEGGIEPLTPEQKFGDGHRGLLKVDAVQKVINVYAAVDAAAPAGSKTVTVSSGAGFAQGDLVLIVQSAGLSPGPSSGDATAIDVRGGAIGRWQTVRLAGVAGSQLLLASPLANAVAPPGPSGAERSAMLSGAGCRVVQRSNTLMPCALPFERASPG